LPGGAIMDLVFIRVEIILGLPRFAESHADLAPNKQATALLWAASNKPPPIGNLLTS
jgi:hypothetical protein